MAQYQNNLFKEYADNYFCEDNDFLWEVFTAETPIGHWLLEKEIPICDSSYHGGADGYIYFDFSNKLSTIKSKIKKSSGVSFKDVAVLGVDGTVFNPRLVYEVLVEDVVDEEPESYEDDNDDNVYEESAKEQVVDPHFLKYNKFNKWAYPYLIEHIHDSVDPLRCDELGLNTVFEWLMAEVEIRPSFNVGWQMEDEGEHPLKDLIERGECHTNDDLIQKMAPYWFIEHYLSAEFYQLDNLLERNKAVKCKEYLIEVFKTNKDARRDYLNIMKKDELVEIATEKHNVPDADYGRFNKSDLADYVSDMEFDEVPFIDLVLTNEGSGANHIGNYR